MMNVSIQEKNGSVRNMFNRTACSEHAASLASEYGFTTFASTEDGIGILQIVAAQPWCNRCEFCESGD